MCNPQQYKEYLIFFLPFFSHSMIFWSLLLADHTLSPPPSPTQLTHTTVYFPFIIPGLSYINQLNLSLPKHTYTLSLSCSPLTYPRSFLHKSSEFDKFGPYRLYLCVSQLIKCLLARSHPWSTVHGQFLLSCLCLKLFSQSSYIKQFPEIKSLVIQFVLVIVTLLM